MKKLKPHNFDKTLHELVNRQHTPKEKPSKADTFKPQSKSVEARIKRLGKQTMDDIKEHHRLDEKFRDGFDLEF